MAKIVPVKIGNGQLAECVIQNGCRHLDCIVAGYNALRLEACEGISLDKFF